MNDCNKKPETMRNLLDKAETRISELEVELQLRNDCIGDKDKRIATLEKALVDMVTSHNGYAIGAGPCICPAHESARKLLGMTRDDVHPLRGL